MHRMYTKKKMLKKVLQKQVNKKNAQKKCTENSTGKMHKKNEIKNIKQYAEKSARKKKCTQKMHIKSAHSGQQPPAVNRLLYFSIALYIAGSYGASYNGFHLI